MRRRHAGVAPRHTRSTRRSGNAILLEGLDPAAKAAVLLVTQLECTFCLGRHRRGSGGRRDGLAGTTVTLDGCLVSDTIDAVAGAFATKLDLPKRIVRLMLEGTQLDAEGTLAHYQITAGCQLHALLRLRGGVATHGGGSKKRAANDAAAGPSAGSRSVGGGSGSKRQLTLAGGGSGSKRILYSNNS